MTDCNPNRVYSEVDGMQLLLKYNVMNAGCCKILLVRMRVICGRMPILCALRIKSDIMYCECV